MQARSIVGVVCAILTACKSSAARDFELVFVTGRTPATVRIANKTFEVPAKSRATERASGDVQVQIEVSGESVTWTIEGKPGERYAVPVSKRQCFGVLGRDMQATAAPMLARGTVHSLEERDVQDTVQVPCGARMTLDELASFAVGHGSYEDAVATGRAEEPTKESSGNRAYADAVALASGYVVATASTTRAILYRGTNAVAIDMPLKPGPVDSAHVEELAAELAKPAAQRSPTKVVSLDNLSLAVTYASIADEFPQMYRDAARRAIKVANAGKYGDVLFLYTVGMGPFLTADEQRALETAGVKVAEQIDAQVAAAAKDVDVCFAKVGKREIACATTKTAGEAAVRLLALLQRSDTHVVARLVDDRASGGATLVMSAPDTKPASDPNGTLPYALAIEAGEIRAL